MEEEPKAIGLERAKGIVTTVLGPDDGLPTQSTGLRQFEAETLVGTDRRASRLMVNYMLGLFNRAYKELQQSGFTHRTFRSLAPDQRQLQAYILRVAQESVAGRSLQQPLSSSRYEELAHSDNPTFRDGDDEGTTKSLQELAALLSPDRDRAIAYHLHTIAGANRKAALGLVSEKNSHFHLA